MSYMKDIFKRMDLPQISSFLLDGVEYFEIENSTYEERLKTGSEAIYKRLEQLYPDESELDKAVADLSEALATHQAVYTEIGMKSGARIIHQLLYVNDYVESDNVKRE